MKAKSKKETKLYEECEAFVKEQTPARLRTIMVDLSDVFLHQCRYEIQQKHVDLDLSCDQKLLNTHMGYRLKDYPHVEDFLREASSDCLPSHLSGNGEQPETFEDWTLESIETQLYLDLDQFLSKKFKLAETALLPAVAERIMGNIVHNQGKIELGQIKATDMSWMLKSCREEAENQSRLGWRQQEIAFRKELEERQIAIHVEHQAHFLLQRPRYLLKDFKELLAILKNLQGTIPEAELKTYLQSSLFSQRVSMAVFSRIQSRFIHYS